MHAVNVTRFVDFVGKASVLLDRLHKLRADQAEEPLALPPGTENKEPEPALSQADAEVSGTPPGEPTEPEQKEDQDPHGEFLKLKAPVSMDQPEFPEEGELPTPPTVPPPIAGGLDNKDK